MKLDSDVRRYILLAGVSAGVLILWFGFGFLMPLVFPDLQTSGQWGDGFNSISSLFNGAGFIALVYTILLQLRVIENQRNQELFKFYYDHLTNLENNITNNFELEGGKGLIGIDNFILYCTKQKIKTENDPPLHYLHSIIQEIVSLNAMIRDNKSKLSQDEFLTLRSRLEGFQAHYLMKISRIEELHPEHKRSKSDYIIGDCLKSESMLNWLFLIGNLK